MKLIGSSYSATLKFAMGAAEQVPSGWIAQFDADFAALVERMRTDAYTVQRTDSLTSPSWTTVSTVSATADGLKSVSIAIPSNKATGFCRIKTAE